MKVWRIDSGAQALVIAGGEGIAECVWWGGALPSETDLAALAEAGRGDITGGMLDALAPLSLCPEGRRSFPGQPGLVAYQNGEALRPAWRFVGADESDGLALHYAADGLRLSFHFAPRPHGIIAAWTRLTADAAITVHTLSAPVLPVPAYLAEITTFTGRWCREFQPVRTPFAPGARIIDAQTGRSGHEHQPHVLLTAPGVTHTAGEAYALHYAWSGGHRMVAEELPDGRRQVAMGHASGSWGTGTVFQTAEVWLAHGTTGLNSVAIPFQRAIREALPPVRTPRPVHYNSWEAVYFKHDLPTLKVIAARAAELGAERFVLDDGWFTGRDDDTTSLGDWEVDARKWPDGLHPLIAEVHRLGMSFGLWVEPEMVNEDSALFRAHPGWRLGPADQVPGRGQYCLDMAREDVREHLFARLDALLTEYPIDYLKWDHNRLPPWPDAAQTRGTYALLDRLRAAHPGVEVETCASGGGRIDAGILSRCGRVWLSDSNDALERLRIQAEAAVVLPAVATGSHVGPRRCHTSGRVLPMSLRAWTAAQRHMGFEMDPRELTDDEAATLSRVTAWWKDNRDWMLAGDIHRLDTGVEMLAEAQIAADGLRFVVFAATMETAAPINPRPLRLTGLDPAATYRLRLIETPPGRSRAPVALARGPLTLPGAALMGAGVAMPQAWPQTMTVIEGARL